jgi:cold shock protein
VWWARVWGGSTTVRMKQWVVSKTNPGRSPEHRAGRGLVMPTGTVKWFSNEKGYGFIARDGGPDVFVHHSAVDMQGFRSLQEGQRVEFEVVAGEKGEQARNVKPV